MANQPEQPERANGPERANRPERPAERADLRDEEALDPELPICDPHHHLWDNPSDRYLLDELAADAGGGHNVLQTVFVECMSSYRTSGAEAFRPVGETEMVAALADGTDRVPMIAGIVGHADLRVPEIDEVLAAHVAAGGGRFRGIRHASAWDADPDIGAAHTNPPPQVLADPAFRAGFAALGAAGLSFDAWLYHTQLLELVDLARSHPEVPIVLDHLGGPLGIGRHAGRRQEVRELWRTAMTEVATCENVVVKLGGIGMPIYGRTWHERPAATTSEALANAWQEDISWCIETFGASRCMFESNFPVDKVSCSYTVLWNAFKRITRAASPQEKAALFHDTAARVYRLRV